MKKDDLYNIALDCLERHAVSEGIQSRVILSFAERNPEDQGLHIENYTYVDLQGWANQFANVLRELHVQKGERLILQAENSPEWVMVFLGAVKAGVIPVPVSPLLTKTELEFCIQDSQATTLIAQEEKLPEDLFKKSCPCLKRPILLFPKGPNIPRGSYCWEDVMIKASSIYETHDTPAATAAYWLYTGGTEGKPKAVIHAHRSIRAHDERVKLWQDAKPGDVVFNTSSLNWSYALTSGFLDLLRHGVATVIYKGPLCPENIQEVIERLGVTIFMSVPGIYRRLVQGALSRSLDNIFKNVRVCLSAGEKLPEVVRKEFQKAPGKTIYEGLGMTEHSVYLVQRFREKVRPGSCGKPLPKSRVDILDEQGVPVSTGQTGILASHRSCEGLMLGYHDPFNSISPSSAEGLRGGGKFNGEWFLSDDLAHKDKKGNFFFDGRRDDVITAGGYRISPLEVEEVLNNHPGVLESTVVGKEIESGKTIVYAFVVCRGCVTPPTREDIITHAQKYLARYKVPREIVFLEQLPKTTNGKIRRKELFIPRYQ